MYKISILYPNRPNSHFDFNYYAKIHMPRSIELLSKHKGFRNVTVEKGVANASEKEVLEFIAMCNFVFDSIESFVEAFTPHADELQSDMQNYTDIEPVIQFNEILIAKYNL